MLVSMMARLAQSIGAITQCGCRVFSTRLRQACQGLDTEYPAASRYHVRSACNFAAILFCHRQSMIDSFARVSGWQQLYHLWELIVMLCKFLWSLLRLLGGG
ncbi:hypothetical protein PQQ63_11525 [Paraburkholderia metrosideri]|uniref:Secreted protein n=1 Tax=Paraburkholderia metrosideri TaxID=580937 RepID=A0ABW9DTF2_9BURK